MIEFVQNILLQYIYIYIYFHQQKNRFELINFCSDDCEASCQKVSMFDVVDTIYIYTGLLRRITSHQKELFKEENCFCIMWLVPLTNSYKITNQPMVLLGWYMVSLNFPCKLSVFITLYVCKKQRCVGIFVWIFNSKLKSKSLSLKVCLIKKKLIFVIAQQY